MLDKSLYLDFEAPIADIEAKIDLLRFSDDESAVDLSEEIDRLSTKSYALTQNIYSKLTPGQIVKVARHAKRPYTLDYVEHIFTDFHELRGDRMFGDDQSIVGGLARLNGKACMVVGHQRGATPKNARCATSAIPVRKATARPCA